MIKPEGCPLILLTPVLKRQPFLLLPLCWKKYLPASNKNQALPNLNRLANADGATVQ